MNRIVIAAAFLAAGALVPFAAGAKPEYTAACNATTHDVTLTWPGGTDVTATTGWLVWPNAPDEAVSFSLPKEGGLRTYTWHDLGTQTGPLDGVEVQFLRNKGYFPPIVTAACLP